MPPYFSLFEIFLSVRTGPFGRWDTNHPRYPPAKLHIEGGEPSLQMHAEKVRTANLPIFSLEPKDALFMISFVGVAAYVLGFFFGLAF